MSPFSLSTQSIIILTRAIIFTLYLLFRDAFTGVLQCRGINSANARVALTNSFVVYHLIISNPTYHASFRSSSYQPIHLTTPTLFFLYRISLTYTNTQSPFFFFLSPQILWGIRLAGYLFHRVLCLGEDKRLHSFYRRPNEGFLDRKKSFFPLKLAGFWTIQAAWAFVCLLPVTYLNSLSVAGGTFSFPRFKVCPLSTHIHIRSKQSWHTLHHIVINLSSTNNIVADKSIISEQLTVDHCYISRQDAMYSLY
jgi:hypothetical protein